MKKKKVYNIAIVGLGNIGINQLRDLGINRVGELLKRIEATRQSVHSGAGCWT